MLHLQLPPSNAERSYIDCIIFPCFGQLYKNKLSSLLDQQVSLHPLTVSIQEFVSAAKEADDESKVK